MVEAANQVAGGSVKHPTGSDSLPSQQRGILEAPEASMKNSSLLSLLSANRVPLICIRTSSVLLSRPIVSTQM